MPLFLPYSFFHLASGWFGRLFYVLVLCHGFCRRRGSSCLSGRVALQSPAGDVDGAQMPRQHRALQPLHEARDGDVPLQHRTPDGVLDAVGVASLLQPPEEAAVQHECPDDAGDLHNEIVVVPRVPLCAEHRLQFQPVTLLLLERLLDLPAHPAYPVKHLQGAVLLFVQEDGCRVEQGDILPHAVC